jgi:AcrR family transcriptional regulator
MDGPIEAACERNLDPRIRRTRLALQQSLAKLLQEKEFDKISVQDITEAAAVNRATFYDHYADKFALLECMVGTRFEELLQARGVEFNAGCSNALRGIITGVCDYVSTAPGAECTRQLPHMEAAVIAVVRNMLLYGFRKHPPAGDVSPEMLASTASWAIYGAAKEWVRTQPRPQIETAVESIVRLVGPLMVLAEEGVQEPGVA